MSASASELEREVEASRAHVEGTVEALKDKMSIGQMVDEAARYLGDSGGSQMVSNLGTQVRDNPLPLVLIGVGLAWLMSGRGTPHMSSGHGDRREYDSLDQDEYRRAFGESGVYAGASHPDYADNSTGGYETWNGGEESSTEGGMLKGSGDAVRRGARGVRGAASGAAGGIGSAAGGLASGIASAASGVASGLGAVASGLGSAASGIGSAASHLGRSAYSTAGSGAGAAWRGGSGAYRGASHVGSGAYSGASRFGRGARRSFSDVLEAEPLVLGAVGLAVGAAIGALLPRTEAEDRYLGDTSDRWREEAEAYAREQFERGKAVAAEAFDAAKAEAEAQGLTPDEVLGRVGDVARATVGRAREAAGEQGFSGSQSGDMRQGSGGATGDKPTSSADRSPTV